MRNSDTAEHLTILALSVDLHLGRKEALPASVLPLSWAASPRPWFPSAAPELCFGHCSLMVYTPKANMAKLTIPRALKPGTDLPQAIKLFLQLTS